VAPVRVPRHLDARWL